jgi:hypothetical protein
MPGELFSIISRETFMSVCLWSSLCFKLDLASMAILHELLSSVTSHEMASVSGTSYGMFHIRISLPVRP